ncbi:MAG: ABC transporter ATP-binding protein [Thermacetogeniaceae bacterium]
MIEVKIKKSFPGFHLDVAFSANKETLALFGPSGSGKSMTFQCISGLLQPDEGYININGRIVFDSSKGINIKPRDRKIGYIFQNYALFPHLTVRKNIAFGMWGLNKSEIEDKVQSLIQTLRLNGLEERYPWQLSGGQQQRVALARALAMEPDVLLMDEPFSALDNHVKQELERELLELEQYYHGNVILITHNLDEAYRLSSQIAVYQAGKIVQIGSKEQVVHHPVNKQVASLTGMKNFIEGQIGQIENKKIIVNTPFGPFAVKTIDQTKSIASGEKAILGIRPEFISLCDTAGANKIKAKLNKILEGLSSCLLEFKPLKSLDSAPCFTVEVPKTNGLADQKGKDFFLYFPPDRLTIMKE